MKELSIEQKAQRYEKALKVAKSNYETIVQMDKDCTFAKEGIVNTFHHMFPELKESEDERIKKILYGWVSIEPDNTFKDGFTKEQILAWLEKQGKNNMSISEATKQVLEDNLNKALEKETPESCNEFLEKQGEQKTAEEYNITGIGSKNAQGKLGEMIKNLKPVNEVLEQKPTENKDYSAPLDIEIPFGAKDSELIQETIRIPDGCYAFIEGNEIVIKKGEKPTWSAEDERHFSWLIEHLGQSAGLYDNLIDWLKSLKDRVQPQPKQGWKQENTGDLNDFENAMMHIGNSFFGQYAGLDPNDTNTIKEQANLLLELVPNKEWSKEDENNILFLTSIIEECFKDKENITLYGDTICANFTKENVINRLKSLRHQKTWKPSDEQINALEYYIYSTSPTATVTKGTIYGNLMVELLEQLKKLKEE